VGVEVEVLVSVEVEALDETEVELTITSVLVGGVTVVVSTVEEGDGVELDVELLVCAVLETT